MCHLIVADQFSGALHDVSVDSISEDDMHVLVFIAGCVGRKLKQSLIAALHASMSCYHLTTCHVMSRRTILIQLFKFRMIEHYKMKYI